MYNIFTSKEKIATQIIFNNNNILQQRVIIWDLFQKYIVKYTKINTKILLTLIPVTKPHDHLEDTQSTDMIKTSTDNKKWHFSAW